MRSQHGEDGWLSIQYNSLISWITLNNRLKPRSIQTWNNPTSLWLCWALHIILKINTTKNKQLITWWFCFLCYVQISNSKLHILDLAYRSRSKVLDLSSLVNISLDFILHVLLLSNTFFMSFGKIAIWENDTNYDKLWKFWTLEHSYYSN